MASSILVTTVTKTLSATASSTSASFTKVPAQGGVLEGVNPVVYNPSNPIILFIIQAGIIIMYKILFSLQKNVIDIACVASAVSSTGLSPSSANHG